MSRFDRAPFIVIWETTHACAPARVHCRAEAIRRRDPNELTTEEAKRLVDHLGQICPSGFLPMPAGSVRDTDLVAVYREDPLFVALRDPERLGGRCGRCEYRECCGGSRARAYAATGDPLAEDPGCVWDPAGLPVPARPAPTIAGGSGPSLPVAPEQVTQALRTVFDPELGLSVVDLGLIYAVRIDTGTVFVTMTLTAPGCPIHDVMPEWIRKAIKTIPGVHAVEVEITFDPPWTPDRITLPSLR